jgi:uncharacterized membrane protein YfcA
MCVFIVILAALLKSLVIVLTIFHTGWLILKARKSKTVLSFANKVKLVFTGIIAFLADTVGMGSFAVNIALAKGLRLLPTASLPGFVNAAQVLPGTILAIFYIKLVNVSLVTLMTLTLAATLGGILGALFISKLNTTLLKKIMCLCFIGMIFLLLATEMGLTNIGGNSLELTGVKLLITAFFMMIAGALSAACVGLYATSQAILFLAGMPPIAAFPIMTAAGALQQPMIAITFLAKGRVPVKETLMVTLFGLMGIVIGVPLITSVSSKMLHLLLVFILGYNVVSIFLSMMTPVKTEQAALN